MTSKEHNNLLSIFFFIQGGLQIFGGILAGFIYGGMGVFMFAGDNRGGGQAMGGFFVVMAVVVVILTFVFAAFYVFTGWKLRKEESIGRILGIIGSFICLLGFPLGTALGIYGLWFFFGEKGKYFYDNNRIASPAPPPPPNSWQ